MVGGDIAHVSMRPAGAGDAPRAVFFTGVARSASRPTAQCFRRSLSPSQKRGETAAAAAAQVALAVL